MKNDVLKRILEKRSAQEQRIIKEEVDKKYRFVYLWYDDPEDPDDPEKTADDFIKEGEKLGLKAFKVDIQGAYSDLEGEDRYIYDGLAEEESPRESVQGHRFRAHRPVSNRRSLRQRIQEFPDLPLTKAIVALRLSPIFEAIDLQGCLRLLGQETFYL